MSTLERLSLGLSAVAIGISLIALQGTVFVIVGEISLPVALIFVGWLIFGPYLRRLIGVPPNYQTRLRIDQHQGVSRTRDAVFLRLHVRNDTNSSARFRGKIAAPTRDVDWFTGEMRQMCWDDRETPIEVFPGDDLSATLLVSPIGQDGSEVCFRDMNRDQASWQIANGAEVRFKVVLYRSSPNFPQPIDFEVVSTVNNDGRKPRATWRIAASRPVLRLFEETSSS